MKKILNILNLLVLSGFIAHVATPAQADTWIEDWFNSLPSLTSKKRNLEVNPYLENSRHLQIPQWEHKNWYAEDWLVRHDGMTLIKGFYNADILRDQYMGKDKMPVLVVGPNFYRLSGLDKRRVTHVLDMTYGMTTSKPNGSFFLKDWHTKSYIGTYDRHGLRLH